MICSGIDFDDIFKKYYADFFRRMSLSDIVAHEDNISRLIDSDLFDGCILQDEIIYIYDVIRDECVCRCVAMVRNSSEGL